jgi:hypothetical protein
MEEGCTDNDRLLPDDARPKTGISWFEAVTFTRRYTEWLLQNHSGTLPAFADGRSAFVRLPTEAEWEYAARGGQSVTDAQMNAIDFFPIQKGRSYDDYAVFSNPSAPKPPQRLAWIGSRCPNPAGLLDTAGNASEWVLDPFRFSVHQRLHGAVGGGVAKGGSFRRSLREILPGRREELPYFLYDGLYSSSDLGFRVALGAIIIPRGRYTTLLAQWEEENRRGGAEAPEIEEMIATGENRPSGPLSDEEMILRELAAAEKAGPQFQHHRQPTEESPPPDAATASRVLLLQQMVDRSRNELEMERRGALRGIIRTAVLSAELLQTFSGQRNLMSLELDRLERIGEEAAFGSSLGVTEEGLGELRDSLVVYDEAIDSLLFNYTEALRESQRYRPEAFQRELESYWQRLGRSDRFNERLKQRLQTLSRHVRLQKEQPSVITQEYLLNDLML